MRAVVMHETGDPSVLHLEDVDPPGVAEGELLIDVRAISINPIDWKLRRGVMPRDLPTVLGSDVSGTVAESRAEGFEVTVQDVVMNDGARLENTGVTPEWIVLPTGADLAARRAQHPGIRHGRILLARRCRGAPGARATGRQAT